MRQQPSDPHRPTQPLDVLHVLHVVSCCWWFPGQCCVQLCFGAVQSHGPLSGLVSVVTMPLGSPLASHCEKKLEGVIPRLSHCVCVCVNERNMCLCVRERKWDRERFCPSTNLNTLLVKTAGNAYPMRTEWEGGWDTSLCQGWSGHLTQGDTSA